MPKKKNNKTKTKRTKKQQPATPRRSVHRVTVRATLRSDPDLRRLARALIALVQEQAAAERAERKETPSVETVDDGAEEAA